MKTCTALLLLALVFLSSLAYAGTVTKIVTETVTTTDTQAPLTMQSSTDPVAVDTNIAPLSMSGTEGSNSVDYNLAVISPDDAINLNNSGVPVNGPNPSVLIPPPPSQPSKGQPSEGQPSVGITHGYITIPWWLVEFIQENWLLIVLLILLVIALYLYMKHREGVSLEIEIPRWAY